MLFFCIQLIDMSNKKNELEKKYIYLQHTNDKSEYKRQNLNNRA